MSKMRLVVMLCGLVFILGGLCRAGEQSQQAPPGEDKYWKLAGFRHGPNFFPRNFLVALIPFRPLTFTKKSAKTGFQALSYEYRDDRMVQEMGKRVSGSGGRICGGPEFERAGYIPGDADEQEDGGGDG